MGEVLEELDDELKQNGKRLLVVGEKVGLINSAVVIIYRMLLGIGIIIQV